MSNDIRMSVEEVGVAPCCNSCPARNEISACFALVAEGKFAEAWRQLTETNPFPALTGRVCPCYCEMACNRGRFDEALAIKSLERFLGDYGRQQALAPCKPASNGTNKVAIIGAGSAGLSAAYYLVKLRYLVTIFEASARAGGMLYWGVPEHRLPKKVLDKEVAALKRLGVEIKTGSMLGRNIALADLSRQGFVAVIIAIGAQVDMKLNIPGGDASGVLPGIEFLRKVNSGEDVKIGKRILVIGGGNTAVDAARISARLGAKVTILYRRSPEEMPAIAEEVAAAEEDGVDLQFLVSPVEVIVQDGRAVGLRCVRNELGEPDAKGRRIPHPIPGSDFPLAADTVIIAVGQVPDDSLLSKLGVRINDDGITANLPHVFAAGDVNQVGGGTVAQAIAAGRKAALSVHAELGGDVVAATVRGLSNHDSGYFGQTRRQQIKGAGIGAKSAAMVESRRCFHCGQAWIEVQDNRCKACGLCVDACKLGLISYADSLNARGFHPVRLGQPEKCAGCAACALVCPDLAIKVYRQE